MTDITSDNPFSKMQREHYESIAPHWGEYRHHNDNPDYWYILVSPLMEGSWKGKFALDFGSGQGRNMSNMLHMSDMERADGCDICPSNNVITAQKLKNFSGRFKLFTVNGIELNGIPDDTYDFVMSALVFQHICVHSIRMSIMRDIYRVMKSGGIFSFQMGFGPNLVRPTKGYFEDFIEAKDTNGAMDVCLMDPDHLMNDLKSIGFKNISFQLRRPWDCAHEQWIYVKAEKI